MEFIGSLKEKDNRKALYAAMIFMMLFILFFLLVSLDEPDPPLQEKKIEIEIEFGATKEGGSSSKQPSKTKPKESAQEVDTQKDESTHVETGKSDSKTSKNDSEPEEKADNSLALPTNNNAGSNKGNKVGDGGGFDENGDNGRDGIEGPYSKNKGRKLLNSGGITEQSQEEGKVALEIYVDEKGLVYRTKFVASKSNGATDYLVNLAVKWAHTMQYEKNLGGGNQYVGVKVFKFSKH